MDIIDAIVTIGVVVIAYFLGLVNGHLNGYRHGLEDAERIMDEVFDEIKRESDGKRNEE